MPNIKITKERIKNHLHYGKWVYLAIAVICWFLGDLLFTMTEYRPPDEREVTVEVVCANYVDQDALTSSAAWALAAGQAFDETLEKVEITAIAYSGDAEKDIYGAQKFTVMVAAGQGDIYLLPKSLFAMLWAQGGIVPLDTYVETGILKTDGLDLSETTLGAPVQPGGPESEIVEDEAGDKHLYGIPLTDLPGLTAAGYPRETAYAVVMAYGKNPETSAFVLQNLIDQWREPTQEAVS